MKKKNTVFFLLHLRWKQNKTKELAADVVARNLR